MYFVGVVHWMQLLLGSDVVTRFGEGCGLGFRAPGFFEKFFGLFFAQDALFKNDDGEFRFAGNDWHALWPGNCKPGLWLTAVSRMGVLLNILLHDDAAEKAELHGAVLSGFPKRPFGSLEIPRPVVFNNCTVILPVVDQKRSRDQY